MKQNWQEADNLRLAMEPLISLLQQAAWMTDPVLLDFD